MHDDKTPVIAPKTSQSPEFRGYSLDQLRYQIVYTSLQKEFCKDKFMSTLNKAVAAIPFNPAQRNKPLTMGGSLLQKMFKGLNYADYAIAGYSAIKTVSKIFSIFRRKKK